MAFANEPIKKQVAFAENDFFFERRKLFSRNADGSQIWSPYIKSGCENVRLERVRVGCHVDLCLFSKEQYCPGSRNKILVFF